MTDKQIKILLDKVYQNCTDNLTIHTPFAVCKDMLKSVKDLNGNILVISNLEFLIEIKKIKGNLDNVWFSTNCSVKSLVAEKLGMNINNIKKFIYNTKVSIEGIENMKFDIIIQNPPYNPNNLWKKFVEFGIKLLSDNGQMAVIHPNAWRTKTSHLKFFNKIKDNISELHMSKQEFNDAAVSTDWYIYCKNNKDIKSIKIVDLNQNTIKEIEKIETYADIVLSDIPMSIYNKITKIEHNNGIIIEKGWHEYENPQIENGKYKQCGGVGNNIGWTKGKFSYTDKPTKNQDKNKVVMKYVRKPEARYFDDNVGVFLGNYWLTENRNFNPESLVILLNSKMFWKIHLALLGYNQGEKYINTIYLKTLYFEGLNVKSEEELYSHYGLTDQEINWINS